MESGVCWVDNFRVDITSKGSILPALEVMINQHRTVKFWKADKHRFLLAWTKPEGEGWSEAPFEMEYEDIANLIMGWLMHTAEYGPEPNHDGHNSKGWRLYNEAWGHVDGQYAIFAAIEPEWAMHGK